MTNITYEAGVKALLQNWTTEVALEEEAWAIIVADTYTPDSTEVDMTEIESNLWDGRTALHANTLDDCPMLESSGTSIPLSIDIVSNKVVIKCDTIVFGTINDNGSNDPGYCVIFLKTFGTSDDDHAFPLVCLEMDFDPTSDGLQFVVDSDGFVLFDPQ